MPKQPFISIPLDIPDVQVLQTEQTKAGEFILSVESTLESTCCRRCGRTITEPHGTDQPRLLRHLPILGRAVYLRIRPKRFRCPFCDDHPTTTQLLDWYDPQGMLIDTPLSTWQSQTIEGRETVTLSAIAPTPTAKDFKLKLQQSKTRLP